MRLFLTFALLVVISSIQFGEGGIYRRYVRRSRPRPPILHDRLGISRREFQPYRPHWTSFFQRRPTRSWNFLPSSRAPRRLRFNNQRSDNQQHRGVPHFHHQQQPTHHYSPGVPTGPMRSPLRWSPLTYGNPIVRDPTFDYAPPSIERVRLIPESRSRRTHQVGGGQFAFNPHQQQQQRPGPPPPPPSYRPSASLWKMLAHKQRPKRPYPPQQHHHHHNNNHIHNPHGMRYHGQSPSSPLYHHQAEIFPRIPNIVYFKPTDVVGGSRRPGSGAPGYKGPSVPSTTPIPAPLPSITSTSTTTPAPTTTTTTTTVATTRRAQTILHAVKTTPVTPSSTHNSAVKPFEPTESLGNNHKSKKVVEEVDEDEEPEESKFVEQVHSKDNEETSNKNRGTSGNSVVDGILSYFDMVPPDPVFPIRSNSFNIIDAEKEEDTKESESNEDSEEEQPATSKRRPVFNPNKPSDSVSYQTSTSVSVSVSKDKVTTSAPSTRRPLTSPTKSPRITTTTSKRVIDTPKTSTTQRTTTEAVTTPKPTESTTTKLPKFANLPVMPKYTRNKTPVYAKKHHHSHKNMNKPLGKYSSAASSSALSKEMNGSGEIVVITGGRSKVKEYKPQSIADNSHLLSFDKVASESSSASSFVDVTSTSASPSSTSTTTSPLQQFDPMQLFHSWLTKPSD